MKFRQMLALSPGRSFLLVLNWGKESAWGSGWVGVAKQLGLQHLNGHCFCAGEPAALFVLSMCCCLMLFDAELCSVPFALQGRQHLKV